MPLKAPASTLLGGENKSHKGGRLKGTKSFSQRAPS